MNNLNKTLTNWPRYLETQRNRPPVLYHHATSIEDNCPRTVLDWTVQGRYRPTR